MKRRHFLTLLLGGLALGQGCGRAQTNAIYFGVSAQPTLTPAEVKALTLRSASDPFGSYEMGGGVQDYFFWWWPANFPSPRTRDGFSVNGAPLVMAALTGAFTAGPTNGWYCAPLTIDCQPGLLWRSYYPQGNGKTRNVLIQ